MNNDYNNINQNSTDVSTGVQLGNEVNNASMNSVNVNTTQDVVNQQVSSQPISTQESIIQPVDNQQLNDSQVASSQSNIVESLTINELKVEEKEEEKKRELPAAEKNFKLSSILLILFFILLLVYILVMPYVGEWILIIKDKLHPVKNTPEVVNPVPTSTATSNPNENIPKLLDQLEDTLVVTCKSTTEIENNYTKDTTIVFNSNDDREIISTSRTELYTFYDMNNSIRDEVIDECNASLSYLGHPGLTILCNVNELSVETSNTYDLSIFSPINDDNISIEADATYKQNINDKRIEMINSGYDCN